MGETLNSVTGGVSTGSGNISNISDLTTGVSVQGVTEYMEEIKTYLLTDVTKLIEDVEEINNALNNAWVGESRNRFDELFQTQRDNIIEQLKFEYQDLQSRIYEVAVNYVNQDKNMISE